MHRTNPDSLRSYHCFRVFRLHFASDFFNLFNLQLVRFLQAEIIVVKHLIQGELNHQPCNLSRRKNDAPNHSATLPTNLVLAHFVLVCFTLIFVAEVIASDKYCIKSDQLLVPVQLPSLIAKIFT